MPFKLYILMDILLIIKYNGCNEIKKMAGCLPAIFLINLKYRILFSGDLLQKRLISCLGFYT